MCSSLCRQQEDFASQSELVEDLLFHVEGFVIYSRFRERKVHDEHAPRRCRVEDLVKDFWLACRTDDT